MIDRPGSPGAPYEQTERQEKGFLSLALTSINIIRGIQQKGKWLQQFITYNV